VGMRLTGGYNKLTRYYPTQLLLRVPEAIILADFSVLPAGLHDPY
jgi:hypothetical protein